MYQSPLHPTLYTPATSSPDKLVGLANNAIPGHGIWRVVICTEDSILSDQLPLALTNIGEMLNHMDDSSPISVFVRVRNPEVLSRLLAHRHIAKLTGFVVPKADPDSFPAYADQVVGTGFRMMPILESQHMTGRHYRESLRSVFTDARYIRLIDCLRIGANDLMGYLGIRRDAAEFTVYQTPVGVTIYEIINEFRGMGGFTITAPVFECFEPRYDDLFRREVRQHIMNGLFGQTVIHPRHLRPVRDMYKICPQDLESARSILQHDTAVNGMHGRMDEHSTHWMWAQKVVERYELFGGSDDSRTLIDRVR